MNTSPDEALNYRDLARQGARISRRCGLDRMPRLESLGAGERSAPLEVTMHFSLDPAGRSRVKGTVRGAINLTCHGCAEALDHDLDLAYDCIIVNSDDQASEVGVDGDVLMAGGMEITVAEVIEDEILLSLPERLCRVDPCDRAPLMHYPDVAEQVAADEAGREAENPFKVLAGLTDGQTERLE